MAQRIFAWRSFSDLVGRRAAALALLAMLAAPAASFAQGGALGVAPACGVMDIEDVDSIRACVDATHQAIVDGKRPRWKLGGLKDPRNKCGDLQLALVRAQLSEKSPGMVQKLNTSRGEMRGKVDVPLPSCETIAEVTKSYTGEYPIWVSCLGWKEGDDHVAHATGCLDAVIAGLYGNSKRDPMKLQFSTTCAQLEARLDWAYGHVYLIDPKQPRYHASLPEGFPRFLCAYFSDYLKRNEGLHEEGLAEIAAEQERRRRSAKLWAEARAKLDAAYDFSSERADAVAQMRAGVHPSDRIEAKHLREALVGEIHRMFPEETMRVAGLEAQRTHTTHGLWVQTDQRPAATIASGVKELENIECEISGDAARCAFDLTVSQTVSAEGGGALADRFNTMAEALRGAFGGEQRSASLETTLRHDGEQWRVEPGGNAELVRFLAPSPAAREGSAARDFSPEECAMLQALGSSGDCL